MKNKLNIENIFVHLRVHSSYSLSFGALQIDKIIEFAKNDNQPAICLTDNSNMFGALEFSEKSVDNGLQPILGCQMNISDKFGVGEVVLDQFQWESFQKLDMKFMQFQENPHKSILLK